MLRGMRHLESLKEQRHRLMSSHYGASTGIAGNQADCSRPRSPDSERRDRPMSASDWDGPLNALRWHRGTAYIINSLGL
jgi:hypothetical protein